MSNLKILGKYLDQPLLVARVSKSVPAVLITGGVIYAVHNTIKAPKEEKKKTFIKNMTVIAATIFSALIASKVISKIMKEHHEHCHHHLSIKELKNHQTKLIDKFLSKNSIEADTRKILEKAKEKILKPFEIKKLLKSLENNQDAKEFLSGEHGLIPDSENIDSKHIFGEIGRLSLLGLFPVVGGITGGIIGDKLTKNNWKKNLPDKIKEGSYQYLANIVLCNVGAGGALWLMEKTKVQSKTVRAISMIGGIVATGIIGGSAIANFIGKKCIDPLFKHKNAPKSDGLYSERVPELLDVGLHVDDIATVGVMSGLKWIEPALPILYSISGIRAGMGYRNVQHEHIDSQFK